MASGAALPAPEHPPPQGLPPTPFTRMKVAGASAAHNQETDDRATRHSCPGRLLTAYCSPGIGEMAESPGGRAGDEQTQEA